MENIIIIAAAVLLLVVVGFGLAIIIAKFYRKVDQGQALIINKMKNKPEVTFTGGIVYPIIHRAEVMDISVKRIDIDRRAKNGLICQDFLRADINVNFFVRVNPSEEKVMEVAQTIGCRRASDIGALEELFTAKFSEALKTAGKQFDFADLFSKRDDFRDKVKQVIGEDLNGFILEDVAIDYLEQTDLECLNPSDVNDAVGIEKIVRVTQNKRVVERTLSNEAEAAIASEDVKRIERVKKAERDTAEIEERTELAKQMARIDREKKVEEEELSKNKEIGLRVRSDEAELLAADQDKLRRAEIAEKDRERALILKTEENLRLQVEEEKRREELEIILTIQKDKKAEEETALLKEAEGRKIEAEERNQTIEAVETARRGAETKVIAAEADAKELRIKEEQDAEAKKKVAEIEAQTAKSQLTKTEIRAEAHKREAEANAYAKERLADAQAKEFAATEMAKVQVEREREELRKQVIQINDEEGKVSALNKTREGEAKAANVRDQGLAQAEVEDRHLSVKEREHQIEAARIRQVGLAEAESTKSIKVAEAEGMAKLAESQKLLDSISQEREEFRLQLEKDKEIALKSIDMRKDVAVAQASVLGEAFKKSEIRIIGGDGQFFDRFVNAASLGQSIDGALDNSKTLQALTQDYTSGDGNLVQDIRDMMNSPSLGASNLRDISLTALLTQLASNAQGENKSKLEQLLQLAKGMDSSK